MNNKFERSIPDDHARLETRPSGLQNLTFTLAVIGAARVGKTTLITKGFKRFQISKDAIPQSTVSSSGVCYPYTIRTARSRLGDAQGLTYADIKVIEVDLEHLDNYSWPECMPRLDAAFVCYDASSEMTAQRVSAIVGSLLRLSMKVVTVACKCDLEGRVKPRAVVKQIKPCGLVEVEYSSKAGKNKMRSLVDWTLRQLVSSVNGAALQPYLDSIPNQEPDELIPHAINGGRPEERPLGLDPDAIVDAGASSLASTTTQPVSFDLPAAGSYVQEDKLKGSLTRSYSFPSLQSLGTGFRSPIEAKQNFHSIGLPTVATPYPHNDVGKSDNVYQTLGALLRRLFHSAVSGDDPCFVETFLLTYCRFASPKTLLLAFREQFEMFNRSSVLTDTQEFTYLRLCSLLLVWTKQYPHDFLAPGALTVLCEIIRRLSKRASYTDYVLSFERFGSQLPFLKGKPQAWDLLARPESNEYGIGTTNIKRVGTRNSNNQLTSLSLGSSKCSIKQLRDVASKINAHPPEWIAEEITRMQLELFLLIEPRDWVYHVLVSLKSQGIEDNVSRFSDLHNHLGAWVASLILSHESVKSRSKQMAKFVEVARQLRRHHNYAGLRAVTVGILNATYDGDRSMEILNDNDPSLAKTLLSHQKLFASTKAHETYRLAFRNVVGPLIPETEIHTYDIVRIQEVNPDFHGSDGSKIHWGKFSVTGRVIRELTESQRRCRRSNKLIFEERRDIGDCIRTAVMDPEMQHSRVPQPTISIDQSTQSPPVGFKKLANMLR